jgi:AcrR family transcriptional regulator
MNKRELQKQERRDQILNCCLDLIISRGYEAMTIRDIASKLGISTGLFFNYFESKEKVYEELVRLGVSSPMELISEAQLKGTPIEIFSFMAKEIFEHLTKSSITSKMFIMMAQLLKSEAAPENVKLLIKDFAPFTSLTPLVLKGQELGQIKPGDPSALLMAYWGAVQGIAESMAIYPDIPLPDSSWIVDIIRANT